MNPVTTKSIELGRELMIREHLIARGIVDQSVIRAMREVPRERFIPENLAEYAYDDNPLQINGGQTISQPYIVAYMAQALELSETDRVLEIGTGSGYAAAVLSKLVKAVYSVERLQLLAESCRPRLRQLGIDNVYILHGDGTLGWPEHAPYDAIVVTAAAPKAPKPLLEQLATGGRLVIPVGPSLELQLLVRVRRLSEHVYRDEQLCGVRFVPLIGAEGW